MSHATIFQHSKCNQKVVARRDQILDVKSKETTGRSPSLNHSIKTQYKNTQRKISLNGDHPKTQPKNDIVQSQTLEVGGTFLIQIFSTRLFQHLYKG